VADRARGGRLVYRVLSLSGNREWAAALMRHRTYRRLGYAVFLAVITVGISQVPDLGKFST
jgi:miniconductance mechanosensitive channel